MVSQDAAWIIVFTDTIWDKATAVPLLFLDILQHDVFVGIIGIHDAVGRSAVSSRHGDVCGCTFFGKGLDIYGADPEKILEEAIDAIDI